MLADEPGLGKTVSTYAVILHGAGREVKPEWTQEDEERSNRQFEVAGWEEKAVSVRRDEMKSIVNTLRRYENGILADFFWHPGAGGGLLSVDRARGRGEYDGEQDGGQSGGHDALKRFITDLRQCGERPGAAAGGAAGGAGGGSTEGAAGGTADGGVRDRACLALNREITRLYNDLMWDCAESSTARALQRSVMGRRRRMLEMITTGATLILAPPTLTIHWAEQFEKTVDASFLARALARNGANRTALIFVDDGTGNLPPAEVLARYLVVVVSTTRLQHHYRCRELHAIQWFRLVVDEGQHLGNLTHTNVRSAIDLLVARRRWVLSGTPTKELAGINGTKTALGNLKGLFRFRGHRVFSHQTSSYDDDASSVSGAAGKAARKAGKAGRAGRAGRGGGAATPDLFPTDPDSAWKSLVSVPFLSGDPAGCWILSVLLQSEMVRNIKEDVPEIPRPTLDTGFLDMDTQEQEDYNARASFIQTNIAMTVKPSGHRKEGTIQQESLLHSSQRRAALDNLKHLRLMCTGGGGRQIATITSGNYQLTKAILLCEPCPNERCQERTATRSSFPAGFHYKGAPRDPICCRHHTSGFGADGGAVRRVMDMIANATHGQNSLCADCGISLLLVTCTPCGHFYCAWCVRKHLDACGECEGRHTYDELQVRYFVCNI